MEADHGTLISMYNRAEVTAQDGGDLVNSR